MFCTCLFFPLSLFAQNEVDALRYSQSIYGPTARSMGLAGAFGALGGDYSTMSVNPAGIAVYRSSEFSFSLGGISRLTESEFQGRKFDDSKFNITIGNIGLVLAKPIDKSQSNWKQISFAIGNNRTNDLGTNSYYQGINPNNSITDYFAETVNLDGGASVSELAVYYPFDANLAYQTYLIDPVPNTAGDYMSIIPNGNVLQSRSFSSKGNQGEFSFGFGANYNDRINLGLSFNFPNIKYEEETIFEETDVDNTIINPDSSADFKSLRYNQYLETSGNGFNLKFGMIVRVTNGIRLGAAIHSPTWYNMNDKYFSSMRSVVNGNQYSMSSPDGFYSYSLNTPFKFVGSLGFVFGKSGLLSVDYEYSDYTTMKLKAGDYNFTSENNNIRTLYTNNNHTLRAGAEIRIKDISLRAGAAYYTSPFKSDFTDESFDQHVESLCGGIGFREKNLKIDLGYSYSRRNEYYQAYSLVNEAVPYSVTRRQDHRFMLTIGYRF